MSRRAAPLALIVLAFALASCAAPDASLPPSGGDDTSTVDEQPDAPTYTRVTCAEGEPGIESLVAGQYQSTEDGAICFGFPGALAEFLSGLGTIATSQVVEVGAAYFQQPRDSTVYSAQVSVATDEPDGASLFAMLPGLGWTELPECADSYSAGGMTITDRAFTDSSGAWLEGEFFPFGSGDGEWNLSWAEAATGGCV